MHVTPKVRQKRICFHLIEQNGQGRDLANIKSSAIPKAGNSNGVLWYPNYDILITNLNRHLDQDWDEIR